MTAYELVLLQAEDEGLWFQAETCPEAYLQQELRKLHAAVEKDEVAYLAGGAVAWIETLRKENVHLRAELQRVSKLEREGQPAVVASYDPDGEAKKQQLLRDLERLIAINGGAEKGAQ